MSLWEGTGRNSTKVEEWEWGHPEGVGEGQGDVLIEHLLCAKFNNSN